MRLGYLANSILAFDGESYRSRTGEWNYLQSIAPLFDAVDLCAAVRDISQLATDEIATYTYTVDIPNGRVVDLSSTRGSPRSRFFRWAAARTRIHWRLRDVSRHWDYAFIMAPGWISVQGWLLHRAVGWPYLVCVRGDWVERAQYRFPAGKAIRWMLPLLVKGVRWFERHLILEADVRLVEGLVLAERYPDIADTFIPSFTLQLSPDTFFQREDTCARTPIRLLYVGSLVRGKGLEDALDALRILLEGGYAATFAIVGDGPERSVLEETVRRLQLSAHVTFLGYVPSGPKLLRIFRECDIFLLPSHSEGFPRVLFEAFSQCLPVVATAVGGIPIVLESEREALLVPAGRPAAMAAVVAQLIDDGKLRRHLIREGYALVQRTFGQDPTEAAVLALKRSLQSIQAERAANVDSHVASSSTHGNGL